MRVGGGGEKTCTGTACCTIHARRRAGVHGPSSHRCGSMECSVSKNRVLQPFPPPRSPGIHASTAMDMQSCGKRFSFLPILVTEQQEGKRERERESKKERQREGERDLRLARSSWSHYLSAGNTDTDRGGNKGVTEDKEHTHTHMQSSGELCTNLCQATGQNTTLEGRVQGGDPGAKEAREQGAVCLFLSIQQLGNTRGECITENWGG